MLIFGQEGRKEYKYLVKKEERNVKYLFKKEERNGNIWSQRKKRK